MYIASFTHKQKKIQFADLISKNYKKKGEKIVLPNINSIDL